MVSREFGLARRPTQVLPRSASSLGEVPPTVPASVGALDAMDRGRVQTDLELRPFVLISHSWRTCLHPTQTNPGTRSDGGQRSVPVDVEVGNEDPKKKKKKIPSVP